MNIPFVFRTFVALSLVMLPLTAFATNEPIRLEPISKWVVNYGDDSCRLSRKFGSTDLYGILILDRFGLGDAFDITLAGPVFKKIRNSEVLEFKFGPNEEQQSGEFFVGQLGETIPTLVMRGSFRIAPIAKAEEIEFKKHKDDFGFHLPLLGRDREAAVSELTIGSPLRQPVQLALGSMKAPFSAMNKCVGQLLTTWGIDVERHATLSKSAQPIGNSGKWIQSNDYPPKMVAKGQPALITFRLSIDAMGAPSACHIQQSVGGKEFDEASCKALMKRAKFEPALDAHKKPMASYYRSRVVFLPG